MLISPPFLPARGANDSDDDWINACMTGDRPGAGSFPLTTNLGWHGGMHLRAPGTGATVEPVRAMADGVVVHIKPPTPQPAGPANPDLPLYYDGGQWTDNGAVVIRHDTEIGEGANAQVRFYSIYMHLRQIDASVSTTANGGRIYRKALLGLPGQIAGEANSLHVEIVCDDDNLRKLVGRASGDLPLDADGRTDAVYGEVYVQLPAGTAVYGQQPLPNSVAAMMQPPTPAGQPRPAPQPLQAVHTTAEPIIVGLRHAGGDGPAGQRGHVFVTSYRPDGSTFGAALPEADAEYNLYTTATRISESYPAGGRPAASAVYELLRFGRVVGPDALAPADVPHWRQVRHDGGGTGWVNLNAADLRKWSDADFPHWRQWRLIDDSADQDSRCDSAVLRGWLDANGDGSVQPAEATTRLADADLAPKLARTVCKVATEWDAGTAPARWGWLKTATPELPQPMSEQSFTRFLAFLNELAFWPGGTDLPNAHWHFQPREFVRHFRRCRWLAEREFKRVYPNASAANVTRYRTDLNKASRKYLIHSATRLAHYYGQAAVESAQLQFMSELFNGDAYTYFRHYAKARNFVGWLGNVEWNDGGDFRGRGFKQMTGRDNYSKYWVYRGWLDSSDFSSDWWRAPGWWGIAGNTVTAAQYNTLPTQNAAAVAALIAARRPPMIGNPDVISTDPFNCIDTAGWFWAKNELISVADTNDAAQMTRRVRGDGAQVGVTQPWPAAAHFPERQAHTHRIAALLGDAP